MPAAEKHFRQPELELAEALTDADRKNGFFNHSSDCPSAKELRQFVAGRSKRAEAILTHLGGCGYCSRFVGSLRVRAVRIRRLVTFPALAAVLIAAWLIFLQPPTIPTGLATIDLRRAAPTRGAGISTDSLIPVIRTSGTLRILLPIGSEGNYECRIRPQHGSQASVNSSGRASIQDHTVVMDLPIDLGQLPAGKYSLALRREGSVWSYFRVELR